MQHLRANTEVIATIGPAVAVGDGFTPITNLALSSADEAELLKHGSTAVVDISGATWAAVTTADGYYSLTMTTALTDTEGMLTVIVNDDSLCLPIKAEFMVLSEAAWDSLYVAKDSGLMDVNVNTVNETAQTAGDIAALVVTADAAIDVAVADLANATDGLGAIKADTAATLIDTAVIGALGAGLTDLGGMSAIMKGQVNTEADTALTDYDPPTKAEMDTGHGLLATEAKQDIIDANVDDIETAVITNAAGTDIAADIIAMKAETVLIVADTGELQTDWVNGGRLDLLIDAIKAVTDALPDSGALDDLALILADTGTDGVVISAATANAIADALLDRADGIEPASGGTERTPREALRIMLAVLAGKLSGAATTMILVRNLNDSKNVISATVDSDGNRTAVTVVDT